MSVLEVEERLGQNLDGNGQVGLNFTVSRQVGQVSFGMTEVGYAVRRGDGRLELLTNNGGYVNAFSGWVGIGAVGGVNDGYELYWYNTATGQYAVWLFDGDGQRRPGGGLTTLAQAQAKLGASLLDGAVFNASYATSQLELGSTVMGYALAVPAGSENLIQVTNGGRYTSRATVAGWSPMGAVALGGGGYELYWRNDGNGQYVVWYLSAGGAQVGGRGMSVLEVEERLGTDINNDGTVGLSFTSSGSASYPMDFGSTQLGYALRDYDGQITQVTNNGQYVASFSGWRALTAVTVRNGYDLYWRNDITGQYALWNLNSQGARTASRVLTEAERASVEAALGMDLDGDGRIGAVINRITGMNQSGQPALPRFGHTQVWTGDRLLIWGGAYWLNDYNVRSYGNGGAYSPSSDSWSPLSSASAPAARRAHSAVWTGSEMIVWGGINENWQVFNDGAIYNPASNTWRPMAAAPMGLHGHTAVWTGTEMIVWGDAWMGNTGMVYNPQSNSWRYTSWSGAPSPRVGHAAVWTGTRMAIWGGSDSYDFAALRPGTGALYDPATDQWEPIQNSGAPVGGQGGYAADGERGVELLWTGAHLIVIPINSYNQLTGSWVQAGGKYDPQTGQWERIETAGAPDGRPYMAAWNGSQLFVVGSSGNDFAALAYDFVNRRWNQILTARTGSFQGRAGTFTDAGELLVFGGMWADGVDEYSGGAAGRRGYRLQLGTQPGFTPDVYPSEFGLTQAGYAIYGYTGPVHLVINGNYVAPIAGWTPYSVKRDAYNSPDEYEVYDPYADYKLYWFNPQSGQYAEWTVNYFGSRRSARILQAFENYLAETDNYSGYNPYYPPYLYNPGAGY